MSSPSLVSPIFLIVLCIECTVLRKQYKYLVTVLDARVTAAHLYQGYALTPRDLHSIQSMKDRPVEAAEMLLNIIMEQPDAVYLCFLDALKDTKQQHIYERLVKDGYQGEIALEYFCCSKIMRFVSLACYEVWEKDADELLMSQNGNRK